MREFITAVPDEAAEYFIDRFGADDIKMLGFDVTAEIVHCKDCKHYIAPGTVYFDDGTTNLGACSIVRSYMVKITPDGFCAWGERKLEDD